MPRPKDIATRYQVLLEGVKSGQAVALAKAVQRLGPEVVRWLAANATTGSRAARGVGRQKALAALRRSLATALQPAADALVADLANVALAAADFERRALESVVAKAKRPAKVAPAEAPAEAAGALPLSATGALPEDFVEQWLAGVPRKVTQRIAQGYARGETVEELTRAIRGTKARNFRDGLLDVTRREAEAVARTTVQHYASAGRQATWEANKDVVSGYRFVATLDSRTTATCRSLDGQVFELGKGPVPPVHINCRSTTVAELNPRLGLDFLDTGATRSSKDGYVPAELSYYDWLGTQPAAFQNDVLGPTRAELFRKGGLSADEFASLQLDRSFRPTTLDEMRRREPLAFERAGL